MSGKQPELSRKSMVGLGLLTAGIGLYFALVGLGLAPPPSRANAPGGVVVACGMVFLLGGVAVLVQALGGANDQGELPSDASIWLTVIQHLVGLGVVGCLAAIGSWIALLGRSEAFSGPVAVARFAFGVGAVISWLYFFALLRRTLRSVRGHGR